MKLIDEIEAAAKAATESVIDDNAEYDDARAAMLLLRANRLWPRIRAALLAGEEMAQQIGHGPERAWSVDGRRPLPRCDGGTK